MLASGEPRSDLVRLPFFNAEGEGVAKLKQKIRADAALIASLEHDHAVPSVS